jgi:hypothetical protein
MLAIVTIVAIVAIVTMLAIVTTFTTLAIVTTLAIGTIGTIGTIVTIVRAHTIGGAGIPSCCSGYYGRDPKRNCPSSTCPPIPQCSGQQLGYLTTCCVAAIFTRTTA